MRPLALAAAALIAASGLPACTHRGAGPATTPADARPGAGSTTGAAPPAGALPADGAAGAPADAPPLRPDEFGPPQPIELQVVARICAAHPCGGRFARVEAWYARTGRIGRYVVHGDVDRCSSPPTIYYDAAGTEVGGIPLEPVTPGSDEDRMYRERHAKLTEGMVEGGQVLCRDAAPRP